MSRDWEENAYEGKHDRMGKATLSHISFGTSILEGTSLKFEFNKIPSLTFGTHNLLVHLRKQSICKCTGAAAISNLHVHSS